MFTSYFFVSCSRHSYADLWETLCDADFDLSYSYEFQCEDCVSASEPDEGWSYYFEQHPSMSYYFNSCNEFMEWYLSAFHCCSDNFKAYAMAENCASYSFSYADINKYLPNGFQEFFDHECDDMSSPCSDLSYSYGVLSFVYTDFTIPYELKVGEAMTLDTSGMTSAVGNPTPELLFDFTAPETTTYTFSTCGST